MTVKIAVKVYGVWSPNESAASLFGMIRWQRRSSNYRIIPVLDNYIVAIGWQDHDPVIYDEIGLQVVIRDRRDGNRAPFHILGPSETTIEICFEH